MKLLKLTACGLPLFSSELTINFFAQQRVDDKTRDTLYPLSPKHYLNCANAFIGINASGKTSVLKVIALALEILNSQPINHIETRDILGNTSEAVITTIFLSDVNELCKLETRISYDGVLYKIIAETLWVKPLRAASSKTGLTDFSKISPINTRSNNEAFLPDDVSIVIAYNRKVGQQIHMKSLLSLTNINILSVYNDISSEVIHFFDPSIETISFDVHNQKLPIHLKFEGKEEILLSNPFELNNFLSSGTIKGIVTFTFAIQTLQNGGYLIIDELENHFNKEITATLIRLFTDSSLNRNGGTLIFSTHYSELLDIFSRNDSIFITKNQDGITATNLAVLLKRNDIKKSEAYQSDIFEGTAPSYEVYMKLKNRIKNILSGEY